MNQKELAYYLTMIKIEGHKTWRAFLHYGLNGFDEIWRKQDQPKNGKLPDITAKAIIRIDRVTGVITKVEQ